MDAFIESLNDEYLEDRVFMTDPKDIDTAYRMALRFELNRKSIYMRHGNAVDSRRDFRRNISRIA